MTNRSRQSFTDAEAVTRAQRVTAILNDDVFKDAVTQCEEVFTAEWKNALDVTKREAAWAKLAALDEMLRVLRTIMDNGKIAAARVRGIAR
jgi:hypothetical protein